VRITKSAAAPAPIVMRTPSGIPSSVFFALRLRMPRQPASTGSFLLGLHSDNWDDPGDYRSYEVADEAEARRLHGLIEKRLRHRARRFRRFAW
jgi:hypothetical protein